ncbi:MAG TPA: SDR family oxidoreductase, partial [Acidimicrobiales bacterium]|nr:SDR family oxidoreductase [Acidimicrobiales bacterium]
NAFSGRLAVVTGGGSGMGRELVVQLANQGCSVASCDVDEPGLRQTSETARAGAPPGTSVTSHRCDVSDEDEVLRFRDEVLADHRTDHIDLLFNNAGIGGGGSLIADPREIWERTFAVDFWGVYYCTRAFMPLLMRSSEALLVNTSSVNGFWASLGPGVPHTAYSTAKFAVKGLSEALIEDLRMNAPNVHVAVVMPGHVGTDIVANTRRVLGEPDPEEMSEAEVERWRPTLLKTGLPADSSTADLRRFLSRMAGDFKANAPLSASEAATIILDALRAGKWRILVGNDAEALDARVRRDPETAYDHTRMGPGLLRPDS